MPVSMSPTEMENLPLVVGHSTGPLTFCALPPTVTLVSPPAAGELDDDAGLEDGVDPLLSLEQPVRDAAVATTAAAAKAITASRFFAIQFTDIP